MASEPASAPAPLTRIHKINLCLLVLDSILAVLWFHRHLEHYLTQSLFVAGGLTVLGLVNALHEVVKWGAEDLLKALPSRILRSAGTFDVLVVATMLLIAALFVTSSIHVEYGGAGTLSSLKVAIESREPGGIWKPLIDSVTVSSSEKKAGQPFFFQPEAEVRFTVVEPRGYIPLERKLGMGTAIKIEAPRSFTPKEFHVLRIIPTGKLYQILPQTRKKELSFKLKVTAGTDATEYTGLLTQAVFAGASVEDATWLYGQVRNPEAELTDYLFKSPIKEEDFKSHLNAWISNPVFLPTRDFKAGEKVILEVIPANATTPPRKKEVTVGTTPGIQTVYWED